MLLSSESLILIPSTPPAPSLPSLLCATAVEVRMFPPQTPLHLAALYGHVNCVRALVELGADLTAKNVRLTPQ